MKIIGVIPARYKSSRFPGKPLADICGKPMIWWVYQQCLKVPDLQAVYVATDDERIKNACEELHINVILTSDNPPMAGDDTKDNISEKRLSFNEFTVQYWAWKNYESDYYGLCHYHRYYSFADKRYKEPRFNIVETGRLKDTCSKYSLITCCLYPAQMINSMKP